MADITYRLAELAGEVQGMLRGDGAIAITGVGHLHDAQPGDIAFVDGERNLSLSEQSEATALIVPRDMEVSHKPFIVTEDPQLAFSKVLALFARDRKPEPGVHPTAIVEESASLGADVSIGPKCYIGHGTIIGDRTVIHPMAFVSHEVSIGEDCEIFPQTYVGPRTQMGSRVQIHAGAVVGADGFGFLTTDQGHQKIPQIGNVIIDDDVEIGANSTVDRATVNATRIGAGTKIDDGVHVAHNVIIGRNCMLCGQVGIAGSCRIGDNVVMGGQVGVKDHVDICDNVILGAKGGAIGDITEPGIYSGFPARRHGEQMRLLALTRKLPDMVKRMKELEGLVAELEARLAETESGA